ncbi:hypothetical protein DFP73DRAFT_573149 [Morchella snyderi]|nr:hypothetical protein DFP73DRAFT_573149 [Morchella snyderi]
MSASFRRLSNRLIGTVPSAPLRRQVLTRGIRATAANNAASNLNMPALSPTMTEGTIGSWKVKEGDEFSAGDVLLEIETDKAQMDVEAQEDGIMAKIMINAGAKAVQVGTRIAVIAEQGDDISALELPLEDSAEPGPKSVDKKSTKKDTTSPPPEDRPAKVESSASSTPDTAQNHATPVTPTTPSPSVAHLLRIHGVSKEDASRIGGTGPKGRLLKGDVLAFLGTIEKGWPKELGSRIAKGGKLDLSNIKIAPPKKKEPAPKKTVEKKVEVPRDSELKLEVSFSEVLKVQSKLQATLGVHLPLSSFITKATEKANQNLPPSPLPPTAAELFDEILGLPSSGTPKTSRGTFTPQITALPSATFIGSTPSAELDIIDILAGATAPTPTKKALPPHSGIAATEPNVLSLVVPSIEEVRAKVFLEKVKGYLEKDPGSLVL